MDTSAVSTALPTIVNALHGKEFVWVGSSYTLAGTAFLPLSGHLANIFGRRPVLIIALLLFAFGSVLSGGAQTMAMLIGGRTEDTTVILPGKDETDRLDVRPFASPMSSYGYECSELPTLPWHSGNLLISGGSTAALLGLTWGGVQYEWSSANVLVPLILGLFVIAGFMVYEAAIPAEPTMPWRILNNRTTISGYMGTAFQGLIISAALFYLPVYFQACKSATPLHSGIDMLPYSFSIAPFAIVAGASASVLNKYRPQNVIAWCFIVVGMGLQSTLTENSEIRNWVGFQIVAGIGFGLLVRPHLFLPYSSNDAWGITIGSTILQNQLAHNLPPSFLSELQGVEIVYSAIPQIANLTEPLKDDVRRAFAQSLAVLWKVMIAISGLGLLSSLLMMEMPLQSVLDDTWGLDGQERGPETDQA
ncbi:hypothetical protein PHLCEN_2v5560 [Hermanssonia centrifuga]|uniref:Uncharacterized protein n=1 Tax=Hermanssonia centrifuga TaxID=98765 RepID=A0A2R6P212_9APHY|nr:hypothetical protein PHLCEN_2v5560 [Hermanssonia centrifuga]